MDEQRQIEAPKRVSKQRSPAFKWLVVSICGFAICFMALGVRALRGGGSSADPLPSIVLKQTFGFTPYYFKKDTPPSRLNLDESSAKFFGNTLTFDIKDSKGQKITVSQKALPDNYTNTSNDGDKPFTTDIGTAYIGAIKGGSLKAELVTKDKTLITLDTKDFLNPDKLEPVLKNFVAIDKNTGQPVTAE